MNRGFTLIELSIVLVIIGLVVGGVLVGRDLIKAATLRKTIGEVEKVSIATNTFRTKYNCLPGDCPSATQLLGSATCDGTASTPGGPTCNGNGDGFVTGNSSLATSMEGRIFWHHLQNAGLLDLAMSQPLFWHGHNYNNINSGINVPRSAVRDTALYIVDSELSVGYLKDGGYIPGGYYGNYILLTGNGDSTTSWWFGGGPTTVPIEDAQYIDSKADDGLMTSGGITGGGIGSCSTGNPSRWIGWSTYCVMLFRNIF